MKKEAAHFGVSIVECVDPSHHYFYSSTFTIVNAACAIKYVYGGKEKKHSSKNTILEFQARKV
jgi:hypothetical protein